MELGCQLVLQIRGQYSLPAYVFNHADEERRLQNEEFIRMEEQQKANNPLAPVHRRRVRIEDQVAVLVGGYKDKEEARKALDKVKKWTPPQLHPRSGNTGRDYVYISRDGGQSQEREQVNPFNMAFVTRNPVNLPPKTPPVDPQWKPLNEYEEYSLLKSNHPLTLLVKQYAGAGGLVQANTSEGFLAKLGAGAKPGAALNAAGLQAHELARVLRQLNFQAYVLHTRSASLVTVGAFNSLEDDDYKRVTQQLAALQQQLAASGSAIKLNPFPAPLAVPQIK